MTPADALLPGFPRIDSPLFERLLQEGCFGVHQQAAEHLHRHGYVVIDLGRDRIAALAERIRADLEPGFDLDGWRRAGAQSDLRQQDAWRQSAAVRELALLPEVQALLESCWGRQPFAFQTLNFPVGTQQHIHSDAVHFHSEPPGFMCGVWVALEDIHADAGPLEYVPGSHRFPYLQLRDLGIQQRPDQAPDQTVFHDVWMAQIANGGLPRQIFTPRLGQALIWSANLLHGGAAVRQLGLSRWSQVSHYFFQGCRWYTPLLSNWPHGEVEWRDPIDVRTGKPFCAVPLVGHLDRGWCLGPGHYVLAGWSTDSSSDACIRWHNEWGQEGDCLLGPVRLNRPDVAESFGLPSPHPDLGFFVTLKLPHGSILTQLEIGDSVLDLTPMGRACQAGCEQLVQFVDACHWGVTPLACLPGLLNHGLGRALLWLQQLSVIDWGMAASPGHALVLVLELDDDCERAHGLLSRLQLMPEVVSGVVCVWIRPAPACEWRSCGDLPVWLNNLLAEMGLMASRLSAELIRSKAQVGLIQVPSRCTISLNQLSSQDIAQYRLLVSSVELPGPQNGGIFQVSVVGLATRLCWLNVIAVWLQSR